MLRPRIQLSCGAKSDNYVKAVEKLCGVPADGYCPAPDLSCHGLIICGGSDVHPKFFGEEINGSEGIDLARDEAEFALVDAFVKAGKPVLGICRGHQLINIYFGGSLFQNLESAKNHSSFLEADLVHSVKAEEDSVLSKLHGCSFIVNSHHHQGIARVGKGLRVTAVTEDGVVEAIEHRELPVFGVQWHPERMCFDNSRPDTSDGSLILDFFISECVRIAEENIDK